MVAGEVRPGRGVVLAEMQVLAIGRESHQHRILPGRLRAEHIGLDFRPVAHEHIDIVVERGDRLIWCAGALARDYAQLGGRTLIAGKPHAPIYEASLAAAAEVLGREIGAGDALAIGDGILTDVKGADSFGIDVLYISGGIHAREYGESLEPDLERLFAFLDRHGHKPVATMSRLA